MREEEEKECEELVTINFLKLSKHNCESPPTRQGRFSNIKGSEDDDTLIQPSNASFDLSQLRCHICHKISVGAIYNCTEEKHSVCCNCRQVLKHDLCLFNGITKCRGILKLNSSKVLQRLLTSIKFSCINQSCNQLISGEHWNEHLVNCKSTDVVCPDEKCSKSLIPRASFEEHCQKIHGIHSQTERPFKFILYRPWNLAATSKKCTKIVSLMSIQEGTVYLVAEFISANFVRIFCFIPDHDVEFAKRYYIELKPEKTSENTTAIATTVRVNLPGREVNEVKFLGRSTLLLYSELDKICKPSYYIHKNISARCYKINVKLKVNVNASSGLPVWRKSGEWKPLTRTVEAFKDLNYSENGIIGMDLDETLNQENWQQEKLTQITTLHNE